MRAIFGQAPWTIFWQPGLFALLSLLAIITIGSPDAALREWHEGQIISSRELYATLYNQSPVPYLTLNTQGKITTCNRAAAQLFQIELGELIGKTISDRFFHEDETHFTVALGKFESGTTIRDTELELTTFQDENRWVSLSLFVSETFDQRLVSLHRRSLGAAGFSEPHGSEWTGQSPDTLAGPECSHWP